MSIDISTHFGISSSLAYSSLVGEDDNILQQNSGFFAEKTIRRYQNKLIEKSGANILLETSRSLVVEISFLLLRLTFARLQTRFR
jgi:hypothetical protein